MVHPTGHPGPRVREKGHGLLRKFTRNVDIVVVNEGGYRHIRLPEDILIVRSRPDGPLREFFYDRQESRRCRILTDESTEGVFCREVPRCRQVQRVGLRIKPFKFGG